MGQAQLGVRGSHHGYDPNQPRVPAGHPDGGQWSSTGGAAIETTQPPARARSLDEIIRDAIEDASLREVYAAVRPRPGPVIINGRPVQATPRQAAELAAVEALARDAIARVREHDPNWRPRPSAYETVEGLIAAHRADAQQARERFNELQHYGIIPGLFFREGFPARGPDRNFRSGERTEGNRLFYLYGCHTCGTRIPGTITGNAILDHQPPTGYNPLGRRQYLFPQCAACSARQGWWIMRNRGLRQ